MRLLYKNWIVGLTVLVVLLLFAGIWIVKTDTHPSPLQSYYTGVIRSIEKRDNSIDGTRIEYVITFTDGKAFVVTKRTSFYINELMPIGVEEDPSITFTRLRKESHIGEIRVGNKVELWDRQVNDHLYEIFELTTLDATLDN